MKRGRALQHNPEQKQAIAARGGYWCCMAGPGSGKTRVIVDRFSALVAEGEDVDSILSLTFTREAAEEMAKRSGLPKDQRVFRTFHSFCRALIYEFAGHLPFHFVHCPPEPGQQRKLLGTLCRQFAGLKFKDLVQYISEQKRKDITPDKALETCKGYKSLQYAQAYAAYEKKCREQGWLDFDSMLVETARLLETNAQVRAQCQFKWVQVDEAQDTDAVQYRIVRAISEVHKNVFLVGDEEQLLYSWRGAIPDGLSAFTTNFAGGQYIYLHRNYRSTPEIVQFCKDNAPKQSELIARLSSEMDSGPAPRIIRYESDVDEATRTISSVLDPPNTSILARTNRQLARFENACIERGIKYTLLGKAGFWHQPEVRNALALLQCSVYPSDPAYATAVSAPYGASKYIKKRDLVAALKANRKAGDEEPFFKAALSRSILDQFEPNQQENIHKFSDYLRRISATCQDKTSSEALKIILDISDILPYYETEEEGEGDNDATENINELAKVSARYPDRKGFLDFARRAIAASRAGKSKRLTISTIHQSKGKEWGTVFVVGVCDGILPHSKATNLAEEKRIFFVACSRAARNLNISFFGAKSPFLGRYREEQGNTPCGFLGQPTLFEGSE